MSSFTSSFRPEARVLLLVAAAFLAGEAALRLTGQRLSLDLLHLGSIPSIAGRVRAHPDTSVLFLGNSLTRNGVHLDTVARHFGSAGLDARFYKVMPDDTSVEDWYFVFKRHFLSTGAAPRVVVVGFALDQLGDSIPVSVERIASIGGLRNAPELFSADLPAFGDRCDYVLASLFYSFSERDRLRLRILDAAIPGYRAAAPLFNATLRPGTVPSGPPPAPSYFRLRRFLDACSGARVVPFFAAMPVPGSYPIDPRLPALISASRGVFFDLRRIDGLQPGHFPDGYHLGPAGAALFSDALAARLAARIVETRILPSGPILQAGASVP